MQTVSIIVPIFNAFEAVQDCLASVVKHTKGSFELVLLDDCSTDSRVGSLVEELTRQHDFVRAFRNPENLGYTRTVNFGCSQTHHDVVLLNSDTLVTPGWLGRLHSAAYSRDRVATVTPLSNAAGAFSVPLNNTVNALPEGVSVERMGELVDEASDRLLPSVPTGNGFCLYITRQAIEEVGAFDETHFPRGYGEENDFCMRAIAAGFVNLIEDSTFVFHHRSASFGSEKEQLAAAGARALETMHPGYHVGVQSWLSNDRLDPMRKRLQKMLAEEGSSGRTGSAAGVPGLEVAKTSRWKTGRSAVSGLLARLRLARDVLLLTRSPLFDRSWYLRQDPELQDHCLHPCAHYLVEGWRAGRDPGPGFCSDWYLKQNPNVWAAGINPLLHYLRGGHAEGRSPSAAAAAAAASEEPNTILRSGWRGALSIVQAMPCLLGVLFGSRLPRRQALASVGNAIRFVSGRVARDPKRPTVLLCGHASAARLFGAERSLLDVLEGLRQLKLNVVTTLPTPNAEYEELVAAHCTGVYVFSYAQWASDLPELPEVVGKFVDIIEANSVDVVHVNTIMLREAATAARRLGVTTVVHAREIITGDRALADQIGLSPRAIVQSVLKRADLVIANSPATAACYGAAGGLHTVSNVVDLDGLDIANRPGERSIVIGLISSNEEKKGIRDFLDVALECAAAVPEALFLAIGPMTPFVSELKRESGSTPANLELAGYAGSPIEAISRVNVLLSLSRVPESFGRAVAEAMAARRPVIAYDHGSVSDLVANGETGYLVPVGDRKAVAVRVRELSRDKKMIELMGATARARVAERCSRHIFLQQLRAAYGRVLPSAQL